MKKVLKRIYRFINFLGFDPYILKSNLLGLRFYYRDLNKLKKQRGNDLTFPFGKKYPVLGERYAKSGTMQGHYFHQDLYVAHKIYENNPRRHIDIGSRTDGFVAHVAVFRSIEIIDIREQNSKVNNITFLQADLMQQLPKELINCCDSVSSLHAIEHFGLGRYGDTVDYDGHIKAIENITEMLQKDGRFYFSVPIGRQRVEFNAQRVFSIHYLIDLLKNSYYIERFSYVDDMECFHENVELSEDSIETNFNCNYGCGIFELIKK